MSGNAAGLFAICAAISAMRAASSVGESWSHLVSTIWWLTAAVRSSVERRLVGVLDAVAGVDQHIDAGEIGAALQIGMDQRGPGLDLGLRRLGIAVARHVGEPQIVRSLEEDDLLGAAGRMRGARQRLAAGDAR